MSDSLSSNSFWVIWCTLQKFPMLTFSKGYYCSHSFNSISPESYCKYVADKGVIYSK